MLWGIRFDVQQYQLQVILQKGAVEIQLKKKSVL